ncbi:protein kinase [Streptosporangium sp. NPDC087985]|uniref:serine/threonine-protein kinase n=1 Tax=Streptosporangium sp. NPDC087985 TaxID=3366196 RepID=UPI00380568F2
MARGGTGPFKGMPPGVRPLTVGDPVIIGRYLLLGRLGVGGMGVVYLAEHPQGGMVALKTPHPAHLNDSTLRARFAEEGKFSRRVIPFCTAAVVEDGTGRDRPYLVSEYIPGPALSQVVPARGPLPPDLAYGTALGVAAALVAVHEAGLVHRDLKPGNVLLSATGPRVIDFGIAREVNAAAVHTQAGQVMGSPGWVAPERLTGGPALPASDLFAWGCLIAYAATGHHPFGAHEHDALVRRIMVEPPRVASVPALLRPAVEACLDKNPAHRPRAADLLGALLAAGGVGRPGDLRVAVAEVLAEIWTPVPPPLGGGRVRLAPAGPVRERPAVSASAGTSHRAAPRRGAHLSQASFAALATVSMAAVTVVAAGGGGSGVIGVGDGPGAPQEVPMVVPAQKTTPGPTFHDPRPPRGTPQITRPVTPSTIRVTTTHTAPMPPLNDGHERPQPDRPRESDDPPEEDELPSPSFTQIPQTGDGESPAPSPAPSATATPVPSATVTPPPPSMSPVVQIDD